MLKLEAYDKSVNSCSLADEFDYIVERERKVKHLSLYHQRRFAKLVYPAAAILEALTLFQMVLNETETDNLLVQACGLYIECEFFIAELQALTYFTDKITWPFLNCVEVSDQMQLTQIIPMWYHDLSVRKMDTLDNYTVTYKHLNIQEPDTVSWKEIRNLMCTDAALDIKLQCRREYGFSDDDVRATKLHKLNERQLKGIPTNNLVAERDLSKFSPLSQVVKFCNYQFKAKVIQNDMTLYKANKVKVDQLPRKLRKVLESKEKEWNAKQKELQIERMQQKLSLSLKRKDYNKKLLQTFKSWTGPCTTQDEVESILASNPSIQEKIVKVELITIGIHINLSLLQDLTCLN